MSCSNSEAIIEDLAARVQRLEDERGILDVLAVYSHAIDAGDEEAWLSCFTPDARFTVWRRDADEALLSVDGIGQLRRFIAGHTRRPHAYHAHHAQQPRITITDDRAECESVMFVLQQHQDAPVVRVFGRYSDSLVRGEDFRWRLHRRVAVVDGDASGLPALVGGHRVDPRSSRLPAEPA